MADVPSEVAYGSVRWRAVAFAADSLDIGAVPDMIPLTGSVTIRPLVGRTRYPNITIPLTAFLRTATCPLVNGWLCGPGATTPDAVLVSSFQDDADVHVVQYEATFRIDDLSSREQPPALVFEVPDGGVIDLSTVLPTIPTPPIIYVVDDTIRIAAEASAAAAAASAAEAAESLVLLQAGVGPAVEDYLNTHPPSYGTLVVADISDSTTTGRALVTAISAAAARTAIGAGTSSLALGGTGVATTAMRSDWQPLSTDITDSTTVGRQVLVAASQAAARTAIGAGTSSVALGGSGVAATAMHSDWRPLSTDISDSTQIGRDLLTATTQAAARAVIGAGTGSGGTGSVYVYHWNGSAYVDPSNGAVPSTAPTGAAWRVYLGPSQPISPPVWTNIPTSYFAWTP